MTAGKFGDPPWSFGWKISVLDRLRLGPAEEGHEPVRASFAEAMASVLVSLLMTMLLLLL